MAKTHPLGFRVEPEVKQALERAAKADMRSVSSLIEKILVNHLRASGFLPAPPSPSIASGTSGANDDAGKKGMERG